MEVLGLARLIFRKDKMNRNTSGNVPYRLQNSKLETRTWWEGWECEILKVPAIGGLLVTVTTARNVA
jgi:hypothetical protein